MVKIVGQKFWLFNTYFNNARHACSVLEAMEMIFLLKQQRVTVQTSTDHIPRPFFHPHKTN